MSFAYGTIALPSLVAGVGALAEILPLEKKLKDDITLVRVLHISTVELEVGAIFVPQYPNLVSRMRTLFNVKVEDGNTYPQEELLDKAQFRAYFLGYDAFIVIRVATTKTEVVLLDDAIVDWEANLLGFFYIKLNFPSRYSHICNGGFFTAPVACGYGVGRCMGEAFLKVVPTLGYKASMFNLVFVSNMALEKLWRSLGFREIGWIPKTSRL